jgi:hypothetical protein
VPRPNRVDQVSVPDALRDDIERIRILEATPAAGITEITSADGSVEIGSPFGPITDLSTYTFYEILDSGVVSVPTSGGPAYKFTFTHQAGDTLIDTATNKVLVSGVYALTAQLYILGLPPTTPNVHFDFAIKDPTSLYSNVGNTIEPNALAAFFFSALSITTFFDQTAPFEVDLDNNDAVAHNCQCSLMVTRIGGVRGP